MLLDELQTTVTKKQYLQL